ncbi:hypothetical protein Q5M85_20300 [Paraclostridium bifermentans]|nr:hypothetical protein [Paraclostridium bifermentans]
MSRKWMYDSISMILSKELGIDISKVNKNCKSSTVIGYKEV